MESEEVAETIEEGPEPQQEAENMPPSERMDRGTETIEENQLRQREAVKILPSKRQKMNDATDEYPWYRIVGDISVDGAYGEGGYGDVHEGYFEEETTLRAIKFTRTDQLKVEKVNKLKKLRDYRYIVKIFFAAYDASSKVSRMFIVMERWQSINLDQFLSINKADDIPFKPDQAISHTRQITKGVHFLHSNDIIHGDLRPTSILVSRNRFQIKISGFGLNKLPGSSMDSSKWDMYKPPEIRGKSRGKSTDQLSEKTDIYAIGRIFYKIGTYGAYNSFTPDENGGTIDTSPSRFSFTTEELLEQANDLLSNTTDGNPDMRPSAKKLLEHPLLKVKQNIHVPHPHEADCWEKVEGKYGPYIHLSQKLVYFRHKTLAENVHEGLKMDGNISTDLAIKFLDEELGEKEVRRLKKLDHINIVKFVDAGMCERNGSCWYLATELCRIDTLANLAKKSLTWYCKTTILAHLAEGLEHLHACDESSTSVHRDLKPHNFLVSSNGKYIKMADFGFCKEIPKNLSCQITSRRGTHGYRTPEFFGQQNTVTKFSDIYQLGLVSFYTLSGGEHIYGDFESQDHYTAKNSLKRKKLGLESESLKSPDVELGKHLLLSTLRTNPYETHLTAEREGSLSSKLKKTRENMETEEDRNFDSQRRPTATEFLQHPFFWTMDKKFKFCEELLRCLENKKSNASQAELPSKEKLSQLCQQLSSSDNTDLQRLFERAGRDAGDSQFYFLKFLNFIWQQAEDRIISSKICCNAWTVLNEEFPSFFVHCYLFVKNDKNLAERAGFSLKSKWIYRELPPIVDAE